MPRKSQSKRINIDTRENWKNLIKTVTKEEIPVSMIQMVTVNLIDGTTVDISIPDLGGQGYSDDEIEKMLNSRLQTLDSYIKDVDFFIDIDNVAKTVQPVTDNILKNL